MRERTWLDGAIATIRGCGRRSTTNVGLIELAEAESDETMIADAERALAECAARRPRRGSRPAVGDADPETTPYVEINAAGGHRGPDWAEMLARMHVRALGRAAGFKVGWLEESAGEEAGIKSCAFKVEGPNAYGWLKTESAFTAWRASRRSTQRPAADQLCLGLGLS